MRITKRVWAPAHFPIPAIVGFGLLLLVAISCRSTQRVARRAATDLDPGWPKGNNAFHQASYIRVQAVIPEVADAELVDDDELCAMCHGEYAKRFAENNVHRVNSCESCHGPGSRHLEARGKEPGLILSFKTMKPAEKSEVCLKCHEKDQCDPGARYRYSAHANHGIACTDCHKAHYTVPPGTPATTEMGASLDRPANAPIRLSNYQDKEKSTSLRGTSNALTAGRPGLCYECHTDMKIYEAIAGPHQIGGPNGFQCMSCHDAHGQILEESRTDLCLQCHKNNAPTQAFQSSIHSLDGVGCTDCHNPHPATQVQKLVNISHTQVKRTKRLPMSVQEPEACYKCHAKIYGKTALPSHHPIREGKMVCSDCHDPHGQAEGNLKAETLNLLCWKCHAEKQGPFVYEHPPVTEDCSICHEAHGTVANNLLRQPATFLCLRCHSGHRNPHGSGILHGGANIEDDPENLIGFYTDCTRCHNQIHGSDRHGPVRSHDFMR